MQTTPIRSPLSPEQCPSASFRASGFSPGTCCFTQFHKLSASNKQICAVPTSNRRNIASPSQSPGTLRILSQPCLALRVCSQYRGVVQEGHQFFSCLTDPDDLHERQVQLRHIRTLERAICHAVLPQTMWPLLKLCFLRTPCLPEAWALA